MDTDTEEKSRTDEILGKLQKSIAATLRRNCKDEAEDWAQHAIGVALSKYRHVTDEGDLVRLLHGIKRKIIAGIPSRGKRPDQPPELTGAEGFLDSQPNPEELLSREEQVAALVTAVGKLKEPCRGLMRLRLQELETPEIAARLRITVNNLHQRQARCLERLRRIMGVATPIKGNQNGR